jgi:outer membrane protein assembly factor BamB
MAHVRKLLHDRDPEVRLRVGMALMALREKEAVTVLIAMLDELPFLEADSIMSVLERLAGDTMPPVVYGPDTASHRKYRDAWEAWWKEHQAKIEPARLEQALDLRGFTTIVLLDQNTIEDLDAGNKLRWKIGNLQRPLDAQLLPGEEQVLVAEHEANRVTVRNLKGEIVWTTNVLGPLMAQRLPNGNTFITARNHLLEVDKTGREVFSYNRPDGGEFMRSMKLRNGDIACIVQVGEPRFVLLSPSDKDFKEVKSWGVKVGTSGGRLDVLPNGHVLIPEMYNNRVVEYDADGQNVWDVTIDQPIAALRLPNGNTVVTLMRENRAVEVDRTGKEVWQFKADTRVTRALRR